MRKTLIWTALALVAAAPVAESQAPDPAPGKQVTVAVVRDGPTPARDVAALVEGPNGPTTPDADRILKKRVGKAALARTSFNAKLPF